MKDFKIYIFIVSALLVVYLVAQYNRPKPINWTETYINKDKIPYGTYVLYNQLHDIFPGASIEAYREPVYNVLTEHGVEHGTYLIICSKINLTEYDYKKLVLFVKKGNDVLISAKYFGTQFSKRLKVETSSEAWYKNAMVYLSFTNKTLDTDKVYTIDKNLCDTYFSNVDTAAAVVLSKNNEGHINFIKYNFSKGALYLNTNPLVFTNYSLLKADGAAYTAMVLSHLKKDSNLMWDEYYTSGRDDDDSPMRVFLRSPALRWAYYIALLSLLVFILYEIKRRQRIIPIIEPLRNTTLDFVNVVGQVYYEQRDNRNIAHKKASYFLEHLRTRYGLKTNILNEEFVIALSHKSGVDATLIRELINQITIARSDARISDKELIALNKNIEQFNIQSR
jgi:hypothetical protein